MKKNAIALAVGALCIAPAAQAQVVFGNDSIGTVQFYGKLYPQFTYGTSGGATGASETVSPMAIAPTGETGGSRKSVDSSNSYLGFRGERNLGSTGLKGIWQIEQAIEIDTGNSDATFSNRNSFLGLAGGFGTVKLGHMDTIYKEFGAQVGMFGITSGNWVSPSEVLSKNAATEGGSFHLRQANSVQYLSPELSGFQLGIQYSPDEARDFSKDRNKELWSFGIKYEAGPLYASVQHEMHKDFFGGTKGGPLKSGANSRDHATRASVTYKLGNHTLAADIAQIEYTESGGILDSYKHIAWDVGIESKWGGPWRTALEYVQAQAGSCSFSVGSCNTDGLKGQLVAVGLAYDLDKNTFLYALAGRLINGKSASFNNWAANGGDVPLGTGADITQVSLGMAYKF